MAQWEVTDIHVTPPSVRMGPADRRTFTFTAGETVTDVDAVLRDLETNLDASALIETATLPNSTSGAVTISDLVRGHDYQLEVTFTNAGNLSWTWLLTIECVA